MACTRSAPPTKAVATCLLILLASSALLPLVSAHRLGANSGRHLTESGTQFNANACATAGPLTAISKSRDFELECPKGLPTPACCNGNVNPSTCSANNDAHGGRCSSNYLGCCPKAASG